MNLFSLLLGCGLTAGLLRVAWRAAGERSVSRLADGLLAMLACTLLGSRLAYAGAHWIYFQSHLAEIPQIWLGGLSAAGAMAGGLLGLLPAARISRLAFYPLLDRLIPFWMPASVGAWMAAWSAGVFYGAAAQGWWVLPARDEWGLFQPRLPLQLIGAALSLLLFVQIERLAIRPHRVGFSGTLGLLCLVAPYALLSFLRADPALQAGGLRLDSWAGLALLAVTLLIGLPLLVPIRLAGKPAVVPPLEVQERSVQ